MKTPISITAIASISPLGITKDEIWASYIKNTHCFTKKYFSGADEWVALLPKSAKREIEQLKNEDGKYRNLDDSVLYALFASRKAIKEAGWSFDGACDEPASPAGKRGQSVRDDLRFGVNIGSSRGATMLFEKYHEEFLKDSRASTLSSPTTTLGNISSWVAHDLQTQGPEISHSITCSTALHALLNGVAWIKSGMTEKFLVGGSEAPLTPFTIAQMKALKIYAKADIVQSGSAEGSVFGEIEAQSGQEDPNRVKRGFNEEFPCQALDLTKKQNSMILGEGASVACLEKGIHENALAIIEGVGYATEPLRHNTSISTDAECFQRSMRMALGGVKPEEVDVIVMHAPGTIKGDLSEHNAIEKVFGNKLPFLTTNKWKIGHTFGASGMLSIELALLMLEHQECIKVPYVNHTDPPNKIRQVMVNAVGFGGNAVSVLLGKS